ncbi:TPA: hypothetical protein EYP83_00430 [Candidatus Geothermarchaeota archaeon]|nr:hypothetical protein [Candidatus Geothermarchaeota archaeon]HIQ13415.1 hypothetical protein [Thermoprotei archaeon]
MSKPTAILNGKNVYINKNDVNAKVLKWIVDKVNEKLIIQGLACTYLYERGSLNVIDTNGKPMNLDDLIIWFSKHDKFFISKYIVFKDLSDKGYQVIEPSEEINHEIPILVISPEVTSKEKHLVYVIEEGYSINIDKIYQFISEEIIFKKSKGHLILAIVERRGGVTYYTAEIFLGATK